MEIHIRIIGVLLILLGSVHVIFPKYLNWKEELKGLSLINRQLMQVHTLFIAVTVFLMGLLCLSSTSELINTKLGKTISLGLAIFWTLRLFIQFFGYSSKLWRGRVVETAVHIASVVFWMYLSVVFWMNYLG